MGRARKRCRAPKTSGEAGRGSQVLSSRPALPADRKRKIEDSATIPDSQSVTTQGHSSSATSANAPNGVPPQGPIPKKLRLSPSKSPESPRKAAPKQHSKSSAHCGICGDRDDRGSWKNKFGGTTWVRCEIKTCGLWHHLSCVCVLIIKDPEHMVFCPAPSRDRAIFICPKCLDQPTKGYDKAVSQGLKTFISTIEEVKKQTILEEEPMLEEEPSMECTIHVKSALEDNGDEPTKEPANNLAMREDSVIEEFELAREEKYNGFDDSLVNGLVRNLHQFILDYDIEIQKAVERFPTVSDLRTQKPLEEWKLVDLNEHVATGQQWFHDDDVSSKISISHAPITAALRSILQTSDGKSLSIASNLKSLTFSQVHVGLVSWFVFDILDNKIDLYDLPNILSMRAMMTAVASTGETRWPGKGRHFLREIQLKTWHKSSFQQTMLSNEKMFRKKLEAFMEPLTKGYDGITTGSDDARQNFIQVALRLWSYLKSLQGKLVMIRPVIGGFFNSKLHEAHDQEGCQQFPEKNSKKKILWVLCRGFQFEEDGMEGPRVLTIKARVVIL